MPTDQKTTKKINNKKQEIRERGPVDTLILTTDKEYLNEPYFIQDVWKRSCGINVNFHSICI